MTSERTLYVGLAINHDDPASAVGIMKLARNGVIEFGEFAYGVGYLDSPSAISLNPLHLARQTAAYRLPERRVRDGGAMPLTIRDALPDAWGRRVIEANFGRELDDIEVLLHTNSDRIGAMVFSESLPIESDQPVNILHSLEELAEAVRLIELSMEVPNAMKRLLLRGGSLGGARPKATFIHDDQRWVAKFPAAGDQYDVEILEAATLHTASKCGIEVPAFFLQPISRGHALLIRRFDREGNISVERRIHYLSASAILNAPYASSEGSYAELATVLRKISAKPAHDLDQLYRRLIFNLFVDNSDDHVKNHGVLHVQGENYRLSPAFDLVPQLNNLGYQQLAITPGRFDSSLSLARVAAPAFGLNNREVDKIINEVQSTIATAMPLALDKFEASDELKRLVASRLALQAKRVVEK